MAKRQRRPAASGGDTSVPPAAAPGGRTRPDAGDDDRSDWAERHLWEIQPIRDVLGIAAIFALIYLGYLLRVVTVPILLAMAFAYLFEPVVQRVTRRGWLRRPQAATALIIIAGVMFLLPAVLGVGFAFAQAKNLAGRTKALVDSAQIAEGEQGELLRTEAAVAVYDRLTPRWRSVSDWVVGLEVEIAQRQAGKADLTKDAPLESEALTLFDLLLHGLRSQLPLLGHKAMAGSGDVIATAVGSLRSLAAVGTFLFGACLTAFFFFFASTGYGRLLHFWEGLIPARKKGRVVELLGMMDRVIAGFVRGRVLVGVILSLFYTVAYAIIGVPAPFLLGPLVGLLQIVPYVSMIGVPISMVLMWLEPERALMWGDSVWYPLLAPMVVYALGQALDDYLLSPIIQGEATDMDVPSIVFASLAGGILAGVYGLLLAIPAAACVKILLREVFWPRFKAWGEGREPDFLPIERSRPTQPGDGGAGRT